MKRIWALALAALAFASCDMMEDSLGDDQRADQAEDVGKAYVADATYYYDGAVASDATRIASGAGGAHMVVGFTQGVQASHDGIKGSMVVSWRDSDGVSNQKTLDAASYAVLNAADGVLLVDMKKVLECAGNSGDGTATVALKVNGLVRSSGSEAGRTLPIFEKNIAVAPMWSTDGANAFTRKSTVGDKIVLATNGPIMAGAAGLAITAVGSVTGATPPGSTPTAASFSSVAAASDGSGVVLTCADEWKGTEFEADITVSGIKSAMSSEEYTHTFHVSWAGLVATLSANKPIAASTFVELGSAARLQALGDIAEITVTVAIDTTNNNDGWASVVAGASWDNLELNKGAATSKTNTQYEFVINDADKIATFKQYGVYLQAGSAAVAGSTGVTATCVVKSLDEDAPKLSLAEGTSEKLLLGHTVQINVAGSVAAKPITAAQCNFALYTDSTCTVANADGNITISAAGVLSAQAGASPAEIYVQAVNKSNTDAKSNALHISVIDKAVKNVLNDAATLGAAATTVTSQNTGVATATIAGGNVVITAVAAGSTTVQCNLALCGTTATTHALIPVTVSADLSTITLGAITKWIVKEATVMNAQSFTSTSTTSALITATNLKTGWSGAAVSVTAELTCTETNPWFTMTSAAGDWNANKWATQMADWSGNNCTLTLDAADSSWGGPVLTAYLTSGIFAACESGKTTTVTLKVKYVE